MSRYGENHPAIGPNDGRTRSESELAGGITNVNLSKIKNNHVTAIRFSTLAAICEALDCRPGDILDYVEDDTPE